MTGPVRFGVLGVDRPLQIVPEIRWRSSYYPTLLMSGVGSDGQVWIGQSRIELTPDERARGRIDLNPRLPRYADVPLADWAAGVQVRSAGGISETLKVFEVLQLLIGGQAVDLHRPLVSLPAGARVDLVAVGLVEPRLQFGLASGDQPLPVWLAHPNPALPPLDGLDPAFVHSFSLPEDLPERTLLDLAVLDDAAEGPTGSLRSRLLFPSLLHASTNP